MINRCNNKVVDILEIHKIKDDDINFKLNKPKIRFNEFEDNWVKINLKDITKRITRKNKDNKSQRALTISAQYGLISQNEFFTKIVASKKLSDYYLLTKGDFAYNKSYSNGYPFGTVKKLDKYEHGVVSTLYICFKELKNTRGEFLEHYFETTKWHKEVSRISVEGARNHGLLNIPVNDFFLTKHYIPALPEQEKIANFLTRYDKLIALQEKKIMNLKIYKKGLLEQIIKDTTIGNWSKTPLHSILTERKEYSIKNNKYAHCSLTQQGVVDKTDRYERDFLVQQENKNYKITKYNDICYNPANLKFGVLCRNTYGTAIFSPIYITFKVINKHNPIFIGYILSRWNFINQVRKYEEGTVYERTSVKPNDFLSFSINIPDKKNQIKIANLLITLDKKIETQERLLESYKIQKKGFLQKMFV